MKKWLSLLAVVMAVCLLPVCAMGEEYETDNVQKQYQFKKPGTFTFDKSKYKEGYIFNVDSEDVTLIFNNVDIQSSKENIVDSDANNLEVKLNNSSLVSKKDSGDQQANAIQCKGLSLTGSGTLQAGHGNMGAFAINSRNGHDVMINGRFTLIGGKAEEMSVPNAISCSGKVTLTGNITAIGGNNAPAFSGNEKQIIVNSKSGAGVNVWVGESEKTAQLLDGSPFADGTDIKEKVSDAVYVRIEDAAPASSSAPKTGDSANIALWLGLMAASALCALGMMRRAKKEY